MAEQEGNSLTWRLVPQIAARTIVTWPIALAPSYYLDFIDESAPTWSNVAFIAVFIAALCAYIGTSIGTCERDGSRFSQNLLGWVSNLYLRPLLVIPWALGNFPLLIDKLMLWLSGALTWSIGAAIKITIWSVVLIIVVAVGAIAFAGISALPVSVAVIIGALIIAAAVNARRH